jgi:hypothetical protein
MYFIPIQTAAFSKRNLYCMWQKQFYLWQQIFMFCLFIKGNKSVKNEDFLSITNQISKSCTPAASTRPWHLLSAFDTFSSSARLSTCLLSLNSIQSKSSFTAHACSWKLIQLMSVPATTAFTSSCQLLIAPVNSYQLRSALTSSVSSY